MRIKRHFGLIFAASFILLAVNSLSAQEAPVKDEAPAAIEDTTEQAPLASEKSPAIAEQNLAKEEADLQWVWGEVVSLDLPKNEIVIKYLDYDTDMEKQMTIAVDQAAAYENIKSIAEIKLHDMVSIDYKVSLEGKNIAKNINLETENSSLPSEPLSNP